MLYGINNNDNNNNINSQLLEQNEVSRVVSNPIGNVNPFNKLNREAYIDESAISKDAYYLYQREMDIKNFSKLVMSDPEDTSHIAMVEDLFSKGVIDPFCVDDMSKLVENEDFLQDISF